MVTRLLKLLRQREADLLQRAWQQIAPCPLTGKYTKRTVYTAEHIEVLELIKELQHLEILDANPTKRRKWTHADTYLSPGALLIVIEDDELAKNEH
jgi:hypothetical protein